MTRSVVNRTLLAVAGILLLGGGALALIGGLNLDARWHLGLPHGWPWTDPHQAVLSPAERTRWRGSSWWWPVVFGSLAVAALLALWWLLVQLGRGRAGDLPVPSPFADRTRGRRSGTLVRGNALARAVGTDVAQLPGVSAARVRLLGHAARPKAGMALRLTPGTGAAEALRSLGQGPVARARASTGLTALPVEVRIRAENGPAGRVD
ncbi:alkaline shock response membrane anchor protein AmaP [Streptacidiphilus sp. P02-A3a]|uniref:alkaline shock response membrane anchor protein AmaP n=1 Tax=Streptacidiphilus sp. P02-A3a TaxID=2704468 RepID=UPI0015FA8EB8|nr:alkaline shock response membrane anchor protein AmaP [Streptacidiphilus sp. P02-A3a]QMU71928.1 alkaline shock response membrane anchor protein AmaP [Streptacidiphilus sp. P02-A3a]